MQYQTLVFLHILGAVLLGGAIVIGQWLQLRARASADIRFIAETYRTLYLVIIRFAPAGGITLLLSGVGLIYWGDFPVRGWLLALILLFAFEFFEGMGHYRPHAKRLMELSREALQQGKITQELEQAMNGRYTNFFLYLDIPMFIILLALAVFKPF